jgi:dCTP deaminase
VWVLVRADSFPVLLAPGKAVSQLRLFDAKSFLDPLELNLAVQQHGILFHPSGERFADDEIAKHSDSLLLSLYVKKGQVGWECRGSSKVLDFSKDSHYQPSEFFEPLELSRDRIMLRRDTFYILTTYERVLVPPELSAELRAIDPRFGEFRSHAAGYIDPGWGWGESGEAGGRPITLEVTMHEDMVVSHRQTIARIRYEKMKAPPKVPYDKANSHYTTQANARLSRHFRQ